MTKEELDEGRELFAARIASRMDLDAWSQWAERNGDFLLALAEEARWRDVETEPPPTWRNVIGIINEQIITVYVESTGKWVEGSAGLARYLDHKPTHWRPLPRGPEER